MDINKFVGSKIREYRLNKNITQQELAEFLNTTSQTVSRYESGKLEANHNILFKIAEFFNISINDFFPPFDNAKIINISNNIMRIPIYGSIKAGVPLESQTDIVEYVNLPVTDKEKNKKFFGIRISGDSMFPNYVDGDTVIFEQNYDVEQYKNKDVAVMINHTESTFKKILINDQGIVLVPYNHNYEMMMFSKEEVEQLPIKVIGIARKKITEIE